MDAGPTSSTPSFEEKPSSKGFLSMFFGDKRRQEVSEDEIRTMVADNEELDDEEKRMIHEVMDLGDATAEEVMTPRVDMIMVGSDETVRQAIDRMRRALAETLFEGVVTGTDYQMHILCSKAFVDANFNVNSIANGDFDQ